jgi:hypothetical protein
MNCDVQKSRLNTPSKSWHSTTIPLRHLPQNPTNVLYLLTVTRVMPKAAVLPTCLVHSLASHIYLLSCSCPIRGACKVVFVRLAVFRLVPPGAQALLSLLLIKL